MSPEGAVPLDARIFIAGHRGLVGGAVARHFGALGYRNLITRTRDQLDLLDTAAVRRFFDQERPQYVVLAAAKVGGILANATYPADFIYQNVMIAANVVHAAHEFDVVKLVNLGSSCIYPKLADQPLRESALLTGPLEETNRAYAVAKIAAIEMCDAYRVQHRRSFVSGMPTNLYGPGDNFDLQSSHVLPALIRKAIEAKESGAPAITLWGTGTPKREFLYVEDLAEAVHFILTAVDEPGPINIGTGEDLSIRELAELICDVVGYRGGLEFDTSKPDGTPRKLMDVSRLRSLGWRARTPLRDGVAATVAWYRRQLGG